MKEITVEDLAEAVGISESHLKKIESGTRQPSMATYQRIVEILGIKMVIDNREETVKEKCLAKAQNILLDKTESEVKYLVRVLECAADNLDLVVWQEHDLQVCQSISLSGVYFGRSVN